MVYRLVGSKLLPESTLNYCQLELWLHISVILQSKYAKCTFSVKKMSISRMSLIFLKPQWYCALVLHSPHNPLHHYSQPEGADDGGQYVPVTRVLTPRGGLGKPEPRHQFACCGSSNRGCVHTNTDIHDDQDLTTKNGNWRKSRDYNDATWALLVPMRAWRLGSLATRLLNNFLKLATSKTSKFSITDPLWEEFPS